MTKSLVMVSHPWVPPESSTLKKICPSFVNSEVGRGSYFADICFHPYSTCFWAFVFNFMFCWLLLTNFQEVSIHSRLLTHSMCWLSYLLWSLLYNLMICLIQVGNWQTPWLAISIYFLNPLAQLFSMVPMCNY